MIISFAWTTPALLEGIKTVTRRQWADRTLASWQKAWDEDRLEHKAYDKDPRAKGRHIGTITLTKRPYLEPLKDMPFSDLEAEGGYWDTLEEFCDGTDLDTEFAVIRFTFEPLNTKD